MKNTKEIKSILTAIYCINFVEKKDEDITKIIEYAFNRIFDCNTNLLTLACVGRTKEEILPEINEFLTYETVISGLVSKSKKEAVINYLNKNQIGMEELKEQANAN